MVTKTTGSNDNESIDERIENPDKQHVRDVLTEVLREFSSQDIDPNIVRDQLVDLMVKGYLPANPYRMPVDVGAVKGDLWFLYATYDRLSFLIEQLEKALERAGTTP